MEAIFDLAPFSDDGLPPVQAKQQYHLRVKAKVFIDAGYENALNKFKVNSRTGIYVVKAIDDNNVYSEKVFIE